MTSLPLLFVFVFVFVHVHVRGRGRRIEIRPTSFAAHEKTGLVLCRELSI